MVTKELVSSILDLVKNISDDSLINEDHVLFLCKKYRSFLIKKEQEKEKTTTDVASEFEYQQICLDLEKVAAIDGMPCTGGYYLRTKQQIPKLLEGVQPKIYPIDYYQGTHISFISRDRMRYVGSNPFLKSIIYVSVGPDYHLYLNSSSSQFMYLKKLRMNAIFEDFDEAAEYLCNSEGESQSCDALDADFPIRDYLVPTLIELVVKEISGSKYQYSDRINNAREDVPQAK